MKKTSKFLIGITAAALLFASCANDSSDSTSPVNNVENPSTSGADETKKNTTVSDIFDFRIKNGKTSASSGSARTILQSETQSESVYETSTPYLVAKDEIGITKEINTMFTLSADSEKGVKIVFKYPQSLNNNTWNFVAINVWSIDANDNYTIRMSTQNAGKGFGVAVPDITLYYPYVLANTSSKIAVAAVFNKKGEGGRSYEWQARYNLDTKSGLGVIDTLPKNYVDNTSHVSIDGFNVKIKNVIAPEITAAKEMGKYAVLYYTDATENSNRWDAAHEWIGELYDIVKTDSDCYSMSFLTLFIPEPENLRKNFFIQFTYRFIVDGYEGVYFFTPEILPDLQDFESAAKKAHDSMKNAWDWIITYDTSDQWFESKENVSNFTKTESSVSFTLSGTDNTNEKKIRAKFNRQFYAEKGKKYKISYKFTGPEADDGIELNAVWATKSDIWKDGSNADFSRSYDMETKTGSATYTATLYSQLTNLEFKPFGTSTKSDGDYSITDLKIEEVE